ncbi:DUF711 family protein [Desulfoluna spongiiphila]|uniref:DUF711 family protein n=1 Tax=Desulfoluna spongiiphila TaxID=419481 RepID=UPI0012557FDE|nr:DUF711 family protein [Desulfoluna spongiiphila]VVS95632.1 uncharacterised protein family upf0210 [Desulfoluna spongiiphila]
MTYQNKALCRVRTITTFLSLDRDKSAWKKEIGRASRFCAELSREFLENGYTVQSIRIVTNPFGDYLNTDSLESARDDLTYLSGLLSASDATGPRVRFAIGRPGPKGKSRCFPSW